MSNQSYDMFMKDGYFFIINPTAGKGRRHKYISEIESFFHERDIPFKIVVTTKQGEATELAKEGAKKFLKIVAVGGDGTVNEVVNGIVGKEVVLGVLPIGSGNDFAKQLGYTKNIRTNLLVLIGDQKKAIDIAQVNNKQYFVNVFGVGFDAYVADTFIKYKKYFPAFPAYLLAVIRILPFYVFRKAKIQIDGAETITTSMLLAAVCNGAVYGGGFKIAPQAKMNDGKIDLCFINKVGRLYALMKLPTIIKGTHTQLKEVQMKIGTQVIIELDRPTIAQVDGEIMPPEKKYSVEVKKKEIVVIYNPVA